MLAQSQASVPAPANVAFWRNQDQRRLLEMTGVGVEWDFWMSVFAAIDRFRVGAFGRSTPNTGMIVRVGWRALLNEIGA